MKSSHVQRQLECVAHRSSSTLHCVEFGELHGLRRAQENEVLRRQVEKL